MPWPFAMREVILSAYELEYFDEDLVAVLYKTVSVGSLFFISFVTCIPYMMDAACVIFHHLF